MAQVEDITLLKLLGSGAFGEVYLSSKNGTTKKFATKKIKRYLIDQPGINKYLMNEIMNLKKLNHPNIVKFEEIKKTKENYYIVTEYINGGDLFNCLENYQKKYSKPFPEEIVQYLMIQIIDAIKYIHSNDIVHRDLKLNNIMVNFEDKNDKDNLNMMKSTIKIIDFGLSIYLPDNKLAYSATGTPLNVDPLIVNKFAKKRDMDKKGYGKEVDIWSLGTICYEMLTGKRLFEANSMDELVNKIEKGAYKVPSDLSKETILFLKCMLQYEGKKRLNINELQEHPFLKKNIHQFVKLQRKNTKNNHHHLNRKEALFNYQKQNTFDDKVKNNYMINNSRNIVLENNNYNNNFCNKTQKMSISNGNYLINNNQNYKYFNNLQENGNNKYITKCYNRNIGVDDDTRKNNACCSIQ